MADKSPDVRRAVVEDLLARIDDDTYPSVSMMNMVETLLTPQEVPEYARVLLAKMQDEQYPSVSLLGRLVRLAG